MICSNYIFEDDNLSVSVLTNASLAHSGQHHCQVTLSLCGRGDDEGRPLSSREMIISASLISDTHCEARRYILHAAIASQSAPCNISSRRAAEDTSCAISSTLIIG